MLGLEQLPQEGPVLDPEPAEVVHDARVLYSLASRRLGTRQDYVNQCFVIESKNLFCLKGLSPIKLTLSPKQPLKDRNSTLAIFSPRDSTSI